jgi:hypothetical protein
LKFLTVDRVTSSIELPSLTADYIKYTLLKVMSSIVAVSLYLAALILVIPKIWKRKRDAVVVIVAGAAGSLLLNALLKIPFWGNEYKYLFTAAICLASFPALALESFVSRMKSKAYPIFVFIILILILPLAFKLYRHFPWIPVAHPAADARVFDLRLDDGEKSSSIFDAIRNGTNSDTVLVVEKSGLHLPTLTQRTLYAPAAQEKPHPGVNIPSNDILGNIRGYDKRMIKARKKNVSDLFNSSDIEERKRSLDQILELNRPLAVILEKPKHFALQNWFAGDTRNQLLFEDETYSVWIIMPGNIVEQNSSPIPAG